MKIIIDYDFDNWNEYIKKERSNKYWASSVKKKELDIIQYSTIGMRYAGSYPIKLTIYKHFKDNYASLHEGKIFGAPTLFNTHAFTSPNLEKFDFLGLQGESYVYELLNKKFSIPPIKYK